MQLRRSPGARAESLQDDAPVFGHWYTTRFVSTCASNTTQTTEPVTHRDADQRTREQVTVGDLRRFDVAARAFASRMVNFPESGASHVTDTSSLLAPFVIRILCGHSRFPPSVRYRTLAPAAQQHDAQGTPPRGMGDPAGLVR